MTVLSVLYESLFGKRLPDSVREMSLAGALTSGLYEVSQAMSTKAGDMQKSLDMIASAASSILRMERIVILLRPPGEEHFVVQAMAGIPRGRQFEKYRQEVHDNIFAQIVSSGEGMLVSEARIANDRKLLRLLRRLDVSGFLAAPVRGPSGTVGVAAAASPLDRRELTDTDLKLLSVMANFAGVAIENASLVARLDRKARKLAAIFEISEALNAEKDPAGLFRLIIDHATELMNAPSGSMILVDRASGVLRIQAERGLGPEVKEDILLRIGEGVTGWVAKEGKPALIGDVKNDPRYVEVNPKVRAELAVPIRRGEEVVGVLNVDHYSRDAFTEEDQELLAVFANVAAVALKNAQVLNGEGKEGT
ncbi:MAG TPA: GAF domain-containing protein [Candidatus Aquicultoraceae bacterium]|nr:GAF domain-containing protein [Candidatus Aquicultoraceae bacterium]